MKTNLGNCRGLYTLQPTPTSSSYPRIAEGMQGTVALRYNKSNTLPFVIKRDSLGYAAIMKYNLMNHDFDFPTV